MRLLLMRHADAGAPDPRRWPDDRLRPLSEEGRARQRRVAETLRRMGVGFDRLLTSPLLRARETAAITAQAYGWDREPEVAEALGDRAAPAEVLAALRGLDPGRGVLCVGHEPTLSTVVGLLIAEGGRARVPMRKSGVAAVDFDGAPEAGRGALAFHLDPGLLLALAGPP